MKSLSDNEENNGGESSGNFPNWLGFSLSPYMKMEGNNNSSSSPSSSNTNTDLHQFHHHYQNHDAVENQQQCSAMSMFLSAHQEQQQQQINSCSSVCFDAGGENSNSNGGFFHTPLTVMPLKSDGSLCILEALSRSQQTHVVSAPKLENFFESGQEGERVALSLDSIYYEQVQEQETHRHQQQQQQEQQLESYVSAMACQGFSEESMFKHWVNINSHNNNVDNNINGGLVQNVSGGSCSVSCGEMQSLSLSMSPGSQSSCITAAAAAAAAATATNGSADCVSVVNNNAMETSKKRGFGKLVGPKKTVHRKSIDTFGQRTSQYRGVTKHRWTGRYEAHLWDNSCKKEGQTRKGRQVYLGGYDLEEKAARAYDLAALKYWGIQTHTNSPFENYKDEIEEMKNMTRQEYVAHLRRKSSGFSRGASIYRGVTRHHQHGRWQARIGRVAGNKDLYLGTFSTQEEAGEAYDVAAIKFRGLSAVTNFDISRYDVEKIMASHSLLAGDQAKRNKVETIQAVQESPSAENAGNSAAPVTDVNGSEWKMMLYHSSQGEQQANTCMNTGDYANHPSFSLALQDLVAHDSANLGSSAHFSNASSLVTSVNSSREGSPDRNGMSSSSQFALRFMSPGSVVSPWIAAAQLRPTAAAIPVAHHPVFAAWGDA